MSHLCNTLEEQLKRKIEKDTHSDIFGNKVYLNSKVLPIHEKSEKKKRKKKKTQVLDFEHETSLNNVGLLNFNYFKGDQFIT